MNGEVELGADNGKALFDMLDTEITSYNVSNSTRGGKAKLQVFQSDILLVPVVQKARQI